MLRKWESSEPAVLAQIPHDLVDSQSCQSIDINHYTKVLGIECNAISNTFRSVVSSLKQVETLTKRALLSDIARLYNILGWCSPAIVKPKIILQHNWNEKCDWDDPAPQCIPAVWQRWRSEFHVLQEQEILQRYFPTDFNVAFIKLHGFCDTSESAYAGVVYIRATNVDSAINRTALVIAKT